jgi:acyl carrier protein
MGNIERGAATSAVIDILKGLFRDNVQINNDTNPIKDLGLESVDGILLAPRVGSKLGIRIPDNENLLVDAQKQTRTVREIIEIVMSLPTIPREKISE